VTLSAGEKILSQRRLSSTTSSADGELPLDRGKLGKYRPASVGRACQYSTAVRRKQAQLGDLNIDQCSKVIRMEGHCGP
jgi:hypothetical protein